MVDPLDPAPIFVDSCSFMFLFLPSRELKPNRTRPGLNRPCWRGLLGAEHRSFHSSFLALAASVAERPEETRRLLRRTSLAVQVVQIASFFC